MKQFIKEIEAELKQIFHHLHQHPETSWHEYDTTNYIQAIFETRGLTVHRFTDIPGLVVEMGSGDFCIGLRADMDALWQEVDGEFKANHSCGHDAHMTMVIGAALLFQKLSIPEGIKLKFIFQPAEEKGTGALALIERDILNDVDFLFGVHLRPVQELADGYASPAIYHGAAQFLSGKIHGEDAHGARPHLGQNAIEIGASIVREIQNIHLDPMTPYTAKMTKFHAGGDAGNLIPGKATFSLDLRAQSNENMKQLVNQVKHTIKHIANIHNVTISLNVEARIAAATVSEKAMQYMSEAIIDTVGKPYECKPIVTSGGEDFHYYTLKKPDIMATMLGLGCGLQPGLHHPHMSFNHDRIFTGVEILTKAILKTANAHKGEQ
ncbi:M20 peptidase aminoacylase family protein [Salirhabdus salicampi]|uniref:M20 peptidase aminoacylase family protein n=1 Tax=Salirhabdus salicampi TaxID=476102 RepID=UPI0020C1FCB0|nr:M20 peptidase aminoacylase family protein [Salirhabdus salicampi]